MARGSYYTTVKIGPKQSLTPEGFLLCEDVPLARLGMMIYGPDETPVAAGPEGVTKIFREAEDLFAPDAIASAQGKDVTDDHPEEDVAPTNWRELTVGVMLNVRRGEGAQDDLLLGDLLIKDPGAIEAVRNGKREVSLGYEADYTQTAEGVGKQTNFIFNHVALVEQGRCGPRCAIKDHNTLNPKESAMAAKRSKILDALMRAFKAKDADELEAIAKDAEGELGELATDGEGEIHIHINGEGEPAPAVMDEDPAAIGDYRTLDDEAITAHIEQNAAEHADMIARIEALEALCAQLGGAAQDEESDMPAEALDEIPEGLQEQAVKTGDSAAFSDSFRDTVAMAEILVPGIRVPTFDGKAKPGVTFKAICGLRRSALDAAYASGTTHSIIDTILGGKPLDTSKMTCDAIRTVFRAAAAARRASNNDRIAAPRTSRTGQVVAQPARPMSIADINRRNAEHYGAK